MNESDQTSKSMNNAEGYAALLYSLGQVIASHPQLMSKYQNLLDQLKEKLYQEITEHCIQIQVNPREATLLREIRLMSDQQLDVITSTLEYNGAVIQGMAQNEQSTDKKQLWEDAAYHIKRLAIFMKATRLTSIEIPREGGHVELHEKRNTN